MKITSKVARPMPYGLFWFSCTLFLVSCITLILSFNSQWWNWSKRGIGSGVLECIPKDQYVILGATISALGITGGIGCFLAWRWIRYFMPLYMAGMAFFSFTHNRPWDGYGSLAWMAITAIYLFRNSAAVAYFTHLEQKKENKS